MPTRTASMEKKPYPMLARVWRPTGRRTLVNTLQPGWQHLLGCTYPEALSSRAATSSDRGQQRPHGRSPRPAHGTPSSRNGKLPNVHHSRSGTRELPPTTWVLLPGGERQEPDTLESPARSPYISSTSGTRASAGMRQKQPPLCRVVTGGPKGQGHRCACVGLQKLSEGLPWWSSGRESAFQCRGCRFDSWSEN